MTIGEEDYTDWPTHTAKKILALEKVKASYFGQTTTVLTGSKHS